MIKNRTFIVTCEHASKSVPMELNEMLPENIALLNTHSSWDVGAINAADIITKNLDAPLIKGEISRLFIDLNRSSSSKNLFGILGKELNKSAKESLLINYYNPFKESCITVIQNLTKRFQVIHISMHSFTPILNGNIRTCEIGILYDPKRTQEKDLARKLRAHINSNSEDLRVRLNYPYKGISDGHTTSLRKIFSESDYIGLEIEFNQKNLANFADWANLISTGLQ